MRVSPPPPTVPRWMVTHSRKTLPRPITRRVRSPRYFRSWGGRPIDANGKICVSSPTVVSPSMIAEAPIGTLRPSTTCGPTTACGPTTVPRADAPPTDARRPSGAPAARSSAHGHHQHGFHHRPRRRRWPTHARGQWAARALQADVELAGDRRARPGARNLAPSTPRSARRGRRRRAGRESSSSVDAWRQRLEHQHARHQRHAGKMALEKLLADADDLERREAIGRSVGGAHAIDEHATGSDGRGGRAGRKCARSGLGGRTRPARGSGGSEPGVGARAVSALRLRLRRAAPPAWSRRRTS